MTHNLVLGAHGEELAAQHLAGQGIEIVERNWRSRSGEIDLVATEGDYLVFVEVKTRSGLGYGSPADAVTVAKQRRIRLLAIEWLGASRRPWAKVRFDVVAVLLERGRQPRIDHIRDAF